MPNGISFLQHIVDGSQPIAIFNSLDKSVELFRYLNLLNFNNKTEMDNLITNLNFVNYYIKNLAGSLIYKYIYIYITIINLVAYYTETEIDTINRLRCNSYLQDNHITTLSITGTLRNNCASRTLLVDNS